MLFIIQQDVYTLDHFLDICFVPEISSLAYKNEIFVSVEGFLRLSDEIFIVLVFRDIKCFIFCNFFKPAIIFLSSYEQKKTLQLC